MNSLAVLFFLATAIALLSVPRRWAPFALLVGCCYMTMGQGVKRGGINLPIFRMLLLVGAVRIIIRQERIEGGIDTVDRLMICLAGWLVFAGFFHVQAPGSGVVFSLGIAFNISLFYFLIRIWCRTTEDVTNLVKLVALLLLPVALEMINEKLTGKNLFGTFGGVPSDVAIRNGKLRAQGPFLHPILAGTVGAVTFPLMMSIWRTHRKQALFGGIVCLIIVVASASSGPLLSLMFGLFALMLWKIRHLNRYFPYVFIGGYLLLELVMNRPAYYIISFIDLTGSSTAWHRSNLIESTISHFSEWWQFGTDYTRHWMATGVSWSTEHADITNYYIQFGVWGGIFAVFLAISLLLKSFSYVGKYQLLPLEAGDTSGYTVWALGAGLFAHATTALSVSYFDQSQIFLWLNLATVVSLCRYYEATREPASLPEESCNVSPSISGY